MPSQRAARFLCLAATLGLSMAHAEITRLDIKSTQVFGEFSTGKYLRIEAEARGALAPTEAIPGLERAARDSGGRLEYSTPIVIIYPEKRGAGNGALLVDVPNRGRAISHGLYNSSRTRPIPVGSLDQGTGFLEDRGYTTVVVQWELGEGPTLPAFQDGNRKLYAEGVGFAAVRDVALFLRYAPAPGNPLAGSLDRAYVMGYSQTARFVKSFLVNGFNEHGGRRVFDGMHIINAAAGVIPLLDTGPGPGSVAWETPGHSNPEHRGVHEPPFTYGEVLRSPGARYREWPRIVVNNTYNDYMGGRAGLARTGARGAEDLPIPDMVRVYDISGAPHTMSRGKNPECNEGQGQLDWAPALRAELVILDEWVRGKATPPASRLFKIEARPTDPEVLQAPAYLAGAVVRVPVRDADGNAQSGLVLPDVAVPIASHGYMNAPLTAMACRQAGTYRPFSAKTLEERYPGGVNEYVAKVRLAAQALVKDRLLLPEDAAVIVNAAADNPAFALTQPRARGATAPPTR